MYYFEKNGLEYARTSILLAYNIGNTDEKANAMKNLLVGNGINIQYDHKNYTTNEIVYRILKNCENEDFPKDIIIDEPFILKCYIGQLFKERAAIINGEYDIFTTCTAERESLESFKKRYQGKKQLMIMDIGFEDYYLIHDLLCHRLHIVNPEQYYVRESMRLAYLMSIYNDGKINDMHKLYSEKFIAYLNGFQNIYTTNYDLNVDRVVDTNVYHLHGQFNKLAEVYNIHSFRNKLKHNNADDIVIDEKYLYLYSNALSTHCGDYKVHQIKQAPLANEGLEKLAQKYDQDVEIRKEIDSWVLDDNVIVANLGSAIKLRVSNPDLRFEEYYPFKEFGCMHGELTILGLSPWNDYHIFETIDNSGISKCTYCYHSNDQCDVVKNLLPKQNEKGNLRFVEDRYLWESVL